MFYGSPPPLTPPQPFRTWQRTDKEGTAMKKISRRPVPMAGKIIGTVLIVFSLFAALNTAFVMLRRIRAVVLKETYIRIFFHQLALCLVLLLFSLDVRFHIFTFLRSRALRAAGWVLRAAVAAAACLVLFLFGKITAGGLINTAAPAENAIVLGLALENGAPAADLIMRVDTAADYLSDAPDALLILTGGNPDENGKTEAQVMRDLLLERGVPGERMLLEDRAETTEENFKNAALLTDPHSPVVLISSNYHMDRACSTARKAGFRSVLRLPAPSDPLRFCPNVMWEIVMELNSMIN